MTDLSIIHLMVSLNRINGVIDDFIPQTKKQMAADQKFDKFWLDRNFFIYTNLFKVDCDCEQPIAMKGVIENPNNSLSFAIY